MKPCLNYNYADYKIVEGDKVLHCINHPCFADLTYNRISVNKDQSIFFYIRIGCSPYTKDEVAKYVALLNVHGFPCYLRDNANLTRAVYTSMYETSWADYFVLKDEYKEKGYIECYTIELILSEYRNKATYLSTLYLLRSLQESGLNKIPEIVFNILDNSKEVDFVQALYLAQIIYYKSGHYIFSIYNYDIVNAEGLHKRLIEDGDSLNVYSSVPNIWSKGRKYEIRYNADIKDILFNLIQKKEYDLVVRMLSDENLNESNIKNLELWQKEELLHMEH